MTSDCVSKETAAVEPRPPRKLGRYLGPLLAVAVYLLLPADVAHPARGAAAVAALMAVYWMTEALPLSATSLIPVIAFPLVGVCTVREATSPYADPIIFLFLGGLMLGAAIEKWNLHRRLALHVLVAVGTAPTRIIGGFMLATALLSMWISNTATTVMMLPIAGSVVALLLSEKADDRARSNSSNQNFAACLTLSIAYAANIGGIGTLIGTPTNAFLVGFLEDQGESVGFGAWMLLATPLAAILLLLAWIAMTRLLLPVSDTRFPDGQRVIRGQLNALGNMALGERNVLLVFSGAALLWIAREPLSRWAWLVERVPMVDWLNDSSIAIGAALLLFLLPGDRGRREQVLDWNAVSGIPWGVLVLMGGGFSLAGAIKRTELDAWIGSQLGGLMDLPPILLIVAVTAAVVMLTEITSNTPTVASLVPVLYALGSRSDLPSMLLLFPATVAASCAFMLPVATPPNAIAYGTGRFEIRDMMRCGIWLNLVSTAVISIFAYLGTRWLFP